MKLLILLLVGVLFLNIVSAEHALPTDLIDDDTGLMEGMGDWANTITQGGFWTLLLLGFCAVLMISTMNYGVARSFGYAGTTGMFGAISLAIIGWMPWWIASLFIVAGAASLVFMIKSR